MLECLKEVGLMLGYIFLALIGLVILFIPGLAILLYYIAYDTKFYKNTVGFWFSVVEDH